MMFKIVDHGQTLSTHAALVNLGDLCKSLFKKRARLD